MKATTTTEAELIDLEKQYWRALKDKDVKAAMHLTDFPCIISGPSGIGRIDEPTFQKMMRNPPYTIHDVKLYDDAEVRMLSDDVAVVAYNLHEELTVDGEPVTLEAKDSSTWIRRDGRWQCALHSEAIAGDPFGRYRALPAEPVVGGIMSDDERSIRTLVRSWMTASQAGDVDKVLSLIADDAIFTVVGREPFGKKQFESMMRAMKGTRIEGKSDVLEVEVLDERAWCRTRLDMTITHPDSEPVHRTGYTLTILRKLPKGIWVVERDANLMT